MLDTPDTIDMAMSPSPGVTMLVIQDFAPWADPDSEDRLSQFRAKLEGYAKYVASTRFLQEYPQADRTMVVVSVLTVTPPTERMRTITNVLTPESPSYEILVRFAADSAQKPQPSNKPWWKFW